VSRKRAVGTREHIIAYLTGTPELSDPGGMASTRLAAAVGYPGSSVAFAQLLSGMERSGLVERDVRGKRTYRIRLGPAAAEAAGVNGLAGMLAPGAGPHAGAEPAGFDYDELARRLLAQIVRRLAGAEPAGTGAEPGLAGAGAGADCAALRGTVAGLETELASAWTENGQLAQENARLREQLGATEQSLALAQESLRRLPVAADPNSAEARLLAPAGDVADWEEARPMGA